MDSLLAARWVGAEGFVIGVDMTPEMLEHSRSAANRLGLANVEFREGLTNSGSRAAWWKRRRNADGSAADHAQAGSGCQRPRVIAAVAGSGRVSARRLAAAGAATSASKAAWSPA